MPTSTPPKVAEDSAEEDMSEFPLEVKLECDDKEMLVEYINEEKVRAVTLKRAGDMLGASEALKAYKALQARLNDLNAAAPIVNEPPAAVTASVPSPADKIAELKRQAIEAKRSGDLETARSLMTQVMALEKGGEGPAVSAPVRPAQSQANKAKTKELMEKLAGQVDECIGAAKYYMKQNMKGEAGMFVARKNAFESDLMAIKTAFLGNKPLAVPRSVQMEVPIDLEQDDVGEDEMKVLINGPKPPKELRARAKDVLASNSDHYLKVIFEWPPEAGEAGHAKLSSTFKVNSGTSGEHFTFIGIKRDMKASKFFDHHKLRVELYKKESSFFSTKSVLIGVVQAKLSGLLTSSNFEQAGCEFYDTSRRALGLTLDIVMKLRRPISNKTVATKTVHWIVFDELSSGRFFGGGPSPVTEQKQSEATSEEDSPDKFVDEIESYAVLEYELEQLAKNPATLQDPLLGARQIALEAKRDNLGMKIELGQLSFEAYLDLLKISLDATKKRALEAKRNGNLDMARKYMLHMQLIEKEIASASDAGEEEDE